MGYFVTNYSQHCQYVNILAIIVAALLLYMLLIIIPVINPKLKPSHHYIFIGNFLKCRIQIFNNFLLLWGVFVLKQLIKSL